MIKTILKYVLFIVAVLIAVILVQTWRFTKSIPHTRAEALPALPDSSLTHLSNAIQIKTVSLSDTLPPDTIAFMQFRNFLERSYPLVHQQLQRRIINSFSYVYYWKGKDPSLKPYVLMAHQDVVPVEEAAEKNWKLPPFSGKITDTAVWGRGTTDDKGSLVAIMETVEKLLQRQYQPQRSIYLCFGHTEELGGKRGAAAIAEWMQQNNIHPALVCDEGGIITRENFKELGRPIALLGIAEKGYASFELSVEAAGGHSSMPAKETAIDILSKALINIRATQMPVTITQPTREMLDKIGPAMPFAMRMALANRWLFQPMLISKFEAGNATNATIHTTIVPTIIHAGIKDNIVPTQATAVINSRIIPGQTSDDVLNFMREKINDKRVIIKKLDWVAEPGKIASSESEGYKKMESISYKLMDDIVPVPFLIIGATDSRYFRPFSDVVVDFSPMLDPKGFHGIDEHLSIQDFQRMMFYYELFLLE
ncbi:MAG TPA: M20/M25/M40 family metallo-hydrolase [Parafilimonas sp.]|nr:M20/M25/M40 family metallo-hydrolase [Parafilimonas sp.]